MDKKVLGSQYDVNHLITRVIREDRYQEATGSQINGRGGEIRTPDLLVPIQAR